MKSRIIDVLTAAAGAAIIFAGWRYMADEGRVLVMLIGGGVAAMGVPQLSAWLEKRAGAK